MDEKQINKYLRKRKNYEIHGKRSPTKQSGSVCLYIDPMNFYCLFLQTVFFIYVCTSPYSYTQIKFRSHAGT
jgi:hypothetical protein